MAPGQKAVTHLYRTMPAGLAYVMLSRTTLIDDLYIIGQFHESKIICSKDAIKENDRLEEICLYKNYLENNHFWFTLGM